MNLDKVRAERFNLNHVIIAAIVTAAIGLTFTLVGTGVVGMITLYAKVATLTDILTRTDAAVSRLAENTVGRDDYVRRDRDIQGAMDRMATKDELKEVQHGIDLINEKLDRAPYARNEAALR